MGEGRRPMSATERRRQQVGQCEPSLRKFDGVDCSDKANDTRSLTWASRYDNNVFNTADLRATRAKKRKPRHWKA